MSSRAALLAAIRAHPNDDTPRLVFADWLDEQPNALDLDRATAEFIRASCRPGRKPGYKMPTAGRNWLYANWARLVPNLMREHTPPSAGAQAVAVDHLSAGTIAVWPRLTIPRDMVRGYRAHEFVRVWLRFDRGFLTKWACLLRWRTDVGTMLYVDQPIATMRIRPGRVL